MEEDAYYNNIISTFLNLSTDLDFVNEQKDVKEAEEEIKKRGLEKEYLESLSSFVGRKITKWGHAQVKSAQVRGRAIAKLLQSLDKRDENLEP
ncbi:hypothetical protein IQ265_28155 [Nodosilinea sp. LEGE 06152]|uniref:hypothetical protein n=1 Tax=Nodosilinea sp. LEGE 06152 TaxID=2777966 RepID=UPI0018822EDB|nr:hypothetical protein [Nodosilinea sp. LEGE 06152]MBE9160666.1 hypothetical protein [Nodosilinea sp. LEGE 06152]